MHIHRADVQGMRAIAVLAVLVHHTFDTPSGGYLGVDVFFVVSGFVITGQLLRERDTSGKISLRRFWWRRVTRLVPALLTVLLVTTASMCALFPGRTKSILLDAAAAAFSVANWRFVQNGTDYFGTFAATSPLQHTWSLSVEEQFYVVWPVLVVVAFGAATRVGRDSETGIRLLTIVAIAGAAASLATAVVLVPDPTTAYFSTATRAWELLAGALVAIMTRQGPLLRGAAFLAPLGLGLVVVSLVTVHPGVAAPFPAATAAVLGTALLLSHGATSPLGSVLGWRPLARVGDISYPLYLWHLPVLVALTDALPTSRWMALPLTLALAVLTHVVVEEPLRALGRHGRSVRSGVGHRQRPTRRRAGRAVPLVAAAAVVTMTSGAVFSHEPRRPPIVSPSSATAGPATRALQDDLVAALRSTRWPDALATDDASLRGVRGCADREQPPPLARCTFGAADASRTVVLLGDSIAAAWLEALIPIIDELPDWRLIALPRNGCPFIDLELADAPNRGCAAERRRVLATVEALQPEVTIVSSREDAAFARPSGDGVAAPEQVAGAARRLLRSLGTATGQTVWLSQPPRGADLRSCRTSFGGPADCVVDVDDDVRRSTVGAAVTSVGARLVDTTPLVSEDGLTPAFVTRRALREDTVHLTPSYSRSLAPALRELLTGAGARLE